MKYALYKQEQTQEIITLFNDTFSDSEGKEEGALIAKLVEDFLTLPTKECLLLKMKVNALSVASFSLAYRFRMMKTYSF
ncbi:hypothetical protein ORY87_21515 [Vibrio parahaemolyticus]|nr:hypothetical protein [Vibrio parahaemolyticus]MCX4128957.1 hypothetical protein [Vibrio parahaemolyticus]WHT07878.1 hypothetical protein O1N17_00590 [Vibrio parahaemolyticus]